MEPFSLDYLDLASLEKNPNLLVPGHKCELFLCSFPVQFFLQTSSRIALVCQAFCSRTIADQL